MASFLEQLYQPKQQTAQYHASMGMRGFGVVGVFLAHYTDLVERYMDKDTMLYAATRLFEPFAHVCVKVFFLITAFLLYSAMVKGARPFFPYMKRRLMRVYPTFLAIFTLYLALSFAFPSHSKLPDGLWPMLTYIGANLLFLPGIFDIQPMITVAWTLSYDLAFYFLLPFVLFVFQFWSRPLWVRLGVMAGIYALIHFFAFKYNVGTVFIAGMAMAEFWKLYKDRAISAWEGHAVMVWFVLGNALYLANIDGTFGWTLGGRANHFLFLATYMPIMFYCMLPSNAVYRFFAWRPLRYLGNMCFSVYLLHGLTIHFSLIVLNALVEDIHLDTAGFWLLCAAIFAATWSVSTAFYTLFERPISIDGIGGWALLRRWMKRMKIGHVQVAK